MPIRKLNRNYIIFELFFGILGICTYFSCQPSFECDPTSTLSDFNISIDTITKGSALIARTSAPDSAFTQKFWRIYALEAPGGSSLYGNTIGGDTTLYSSLSFPLSNALDSTTYVLVINRSKGFTIDTVSDTLKLKYSRKLNYISRGCGYVYNYIVNEQTLTKHYFTRDTLMNNVVNTQGGINLKIYYTP